MSRLRYVGRRLVGVGVSVWAVFTLAFVYVAYTPTQERALTGEGAPAAASDPLATQYVDWLLWFLTIQDEPVMATIVEHVQFTAAYLVPGLLFAVACGVGVRMYTVARERSGADRAVDAVTLLAVSIPVFLLAYAFREWMLPVYIAEFGYYDIYKPELGPFAYRNLVGAAWPASVMGVYLLAIQLRYAGEELRAYVTADFVKTARAKGAGPLRVGRHVFRNAAIPLLTLFFTDMLGMVVVGIFVVEYITYVPGIGQLMIDALLAGDLRLMLAVAVLTVVAGVLTNFAQDVAYLLFDPRVDPDG